MLTTLKEAFRLDSASIFVLNFLLDFLLRVEVLNDGLTVNIGQVVFVMAPITKLNLNLL